VSASDVKKRAVMYLFDGDDSFVVISEREREEVVEVEDGTL
jgi:hypothetical protein